MRAGRADAQVLPAGDVGHVRPEPAELRCRRRRRWGRRGVEISRTDCTARADALDELAFLDGGQHRVDVLDEVERRRVEEHVLLLDAEGERVARAELVVEHAAARREPLPRDRGGIDLLHSSFTTASTSISTSQRGSTNPRTTIIAFTGRMEENTSPWARAAPVEVLGVRQEDARAHDVLGPRARFLEGGEDDLEAALRLAVGSAGGSAPSGMIGAVPATNTWGPTRTARE